MPVTELTGKLVKDGSVETADLADLSVTNIKLAADAVTTDKILNGTILGSDIASGTITSSNIQDGTIVKADVSLSDIVVLNPVSNQTGMINLNHAQPLQGGTLSATSGFRLGAFPGNSPSTWVYLSQRDAVAYQNFAAGNIFSNGYMDSVTGFRYNGTAPSGQFLRGNGTNFIPANIALTDIGLAGTNNYTVKYVGANSLGTGIIQDDGTQAMVNGKFGVGAVYVDPATIFNRDSLLFNPQPFIEVETFIGFTGLNNTINSYVTFTDTNLPYGKVILNSAAHTLRSDFITVTPGEDIYVEAWAMRQTGATGTAGGLYIGVLQYDKDKMPIDATDGANYFVANNVTIATNSTWNKYSGTYTIPSSHTPYSGSDGAGIRYIKTIILINSPSGTIPTYWGGISYRRTNLFKDSGLVKFKGNVNILGSLRVGAAGNANDILNTTSGSTPSGNLFWGNRTILDSSNYTSYLSTTVTMGGDITGNSNASTVVGIRGHNFPNPGSPENNKLLRWSNSSGQYFWDNETDTLSSVCSRGNSYGSTIQLDSLIITSSASLDAIKMNQGGPISFYDLSTIHTGDIGANSGTFFLHPSGSSVMSLGGPINFGTGGTDLVWSFDTSLTVGSSGSAAALPGPPAGYLIFKIGASTFKIPYYNS